MWIYLVKTKDELLSVFQKFKLLVEKEAERKLKIIRSDGGGEYTSNDFKSYCVNHGISHKVIAPYTPQHNGCVREETEL
jgi:transposase InsO family protein